MTYVSPDPIEQRKAQLDHLLASSDADRLAALTVREATGLDPNNAEYDRAVTRYETAIKSAPGGPPMPITPQERVARQQDADRIRHSSQMERGGTDAATQAIQDRYIAGEIDEVELVRLTREHVAPRTRL